jgi:lipid A 3-O-deacylase
MTSRRAVPEAWQRLLVLGIALCGAATAAAERPPPGGTSSFIQAGVAEQASAHAVGLTWDWRWARDTRWGTVTGYLETSLGQWRSRAPRQHGSAFVTQVGITPVFRLAPSAGGPGWFQEIGIGANLLFPVYENQAKRFSTTFNFGDHFAIGRRFGKHEFALRIQHFSNAGIKRPNPGENFLQLRYAIRY